LELRWTFRNDPEIVGEGDNGQEVAEDTILATSHREAPFAPTTTFDEFQNVFVKAVVENSWRIRAALAQGLRSFNFFRLDPAHDDTHFLSPRLPDHGTRDELGKAPFGKSGGNEGV
jgi:hypothetical protein